MKKIKTILIMLIFSFTILSCDIRTTSNTTTIETTLNTSTTQASTPTTQLPTTTTTTTKEEINSEDRIQVIDLYSVNDFHGGAYNDIESLQNIAGFMEYRNAVNENTIFLANGDIFQGAALSNYYQGRPIVEAFNLMSLDGFILGNHEFDWGIEEILKYRDSNLENGEMNYPILAANIVYKDTQTPLVNTIPYLIKEVSGVRVGVIGLIDQLEDSISASRLENIAFKDPVDTTYHYARELREDQDCDIVVVYIHGSSQYYNQEVASFTGSHLIDAVFNGHMHWNEMGEISRAWEVPLFYAQANNYWGKDNAYIAHIALEYDTLEEKIIYETYAFDDVNPNRSKARNYTGSEVTQYSNQAVITIINNYATRPDYLNITNEILASTNTYIDRYDLAPWGADVLRDYLDVDFGAINSGGFRVSIDAGDITVGQMMEVYPFDNYIKTCEMTGAQVRNLVTHLLYEDVVWDSSIEKRNNVLYVNDVPINDNQVYTIGAVDYIFDKADYGFLEGSNIQNTGFLMRNLLLEDLRNVPDGTNFNPNDGSHYFELSQSYDPEYFKKLLVIYQ